MRWLIVIACLWSALAQAQIVNIENKRIYDDTAGWSGSLDAGFSAQQNGQLFYNLNFRPRVQYKTRKHYFFVLGDLAYTGSNAQTYTNAGMMHFRYNRRIKNGPWKWELYTQIQYNELLNQRLRTLAGTGLRWKFIDTNNIRFFAGTSFFYEYEELQTDGVINEAVRWSNYLSWFISRKGFSFTGITYYQPQVDRLNDFRFSGQYTLGVGLTKRVDVRFEFNLFYDANPPTNIRKMVFSSSAGVRLKLGE
jgi:hypothetical protein